MTGVYVKYLLPGMFLSGHNNLLFVWLVALKKPIFFVIMTIIVSILYVPGLSYLMFTLGMGINAMGIAMFIQQLILFIFILGYLHTQKDI